MSVPDLKSFDAVLLDLDGTIWHEEVALPGAIELIHSLQRRGQPFAFVSNSGLSPRRLVERLGRMGAIVEPAHLYTAASAGCDYVRLHYPRGVRVFNVGSDSVHELLDGYATFVSADDEQADVVMSASLANANATGPRFNVALRHLLRGAPLVALCNDRSYPTPRGAEIGAGAVAAMLGFAANIRPVLCGKPQRLFFEELCGHLKVRPERCVLIGDNLEADVGGARPLGMTTILPLTGVTTRQQLALIETGGLGPDHVVEDLRALAREGTTNDD